MVNRSDDGASHAGHDVGMNDRVLITGASGFIGRHLVTALAKDGVVVTAATRSDAGDFSPAVRRVRLPDLNGRVDWLALLDNIDVVVHLAGIAHTRARNDAYNRVNRVATADLAAAGAKAGIRRLVFMSSIRAQIGPSAHHVISEDDAPKPTDDYGRSKLAAEDAVRASGVPFTILRPTLIYGSQVKGNFAALLRLVASPWPLPFAALRNRRSLTGTDNLIEAVRFALATRAAGETYIVADPAPLTVAEILATLRSAFHASPRLFPVPPALFAAAFAALGRGDLWQRIGGELIADPRKLLAEGWQPLVTTREGLIKMAKAANEALLAKA